MYCDLTSTILSRLWNIPGYQNIFYSKTWFTELCNLVANASMPVEVMSSVPNTCMLESLVQQLLRGHMSAVVAVQFHRTRGRLFSLSRDRVLRIWDVQLQVCLQRMTGIFPKGLEGELCVMCGIPLKYPLLVFTKHYAQKQSQTGGGISSNVFFYS